MRPPICAICLNDFRQSTSEGGGVHFKLSEEEKARKKHMKDNYMVGHPPGYEWFCGEHIELAKKYNHLTWDEAWLEIKDEAGKK